MKSTDKNILEFIEILKQLELIRFDVEFCRAINLKHQNLNRIRKGMAYFTPDHIKNMIKKYRVNANWIFGFSDQIFLEVHAHTKAYTKSVKNSQ